MSEAKPPSRTKAEGSASTVANLLLRLQEDSKLLAEFNIDPDKVMIEAGITSEEDRNVLKTRDMLKIHQLLEKKIYTNNRKEGEEEDKI